MALLLAGVLGSWAALDLGASAVLEDLRRAERRAQREAIEARVAKRRKVQVKLLKIKVQPLERFPEGGLSKIESPSGGKFSCTAPAPSQMV